MSGDVHVRFCEGPEGKFLWATRLVMCVQYQDEATRILVELRKRLEKFGLELSAEKTKVIGFGRFSIENAKKKGQRAGTYNFLGFTHFSDKTRKASLR